LIPLKLDTSTWTIRKLHPPICQGRSYHDRATNGSRSFFCVWYPSRKRPRRPDRLKAKPFGRYAALTQPSRRGKGLPSLKPEPGLSP
jgi:hypothetical protein